MSAFDEAPKDGSQVMFWRRTERGEYEGPFLAKFCPERQEWRHGPMGGDRPFIDFEPTHWQLVTPPLDTALL